MNSRQLQGLINSISGGQIQQILAAILAIITAIGGIGVVGSSEGGLGGGTNINRPSDTGTPVAPKGETFPLANVRDSGEAIKGNVVVGKKRYANAWTFGYGDDQVFQLNADYHTLTGSVGLVDGTPAKQMDLTFEARLASGGNKYYTFTVNKNNPIREITVPVKDAESIRVYAGLVSQTNIALFDAHLHN